MSLRDAIRSWVLVQGNSQRAAARHFDVSRTTVTKLLQEEKASQERRSQRAKAVKHQRPVRDLALPPIQGWLKENDWLARWAPTQRWTAHRMWAELGQLGIPVAESTVRLFVRQFRQPPKPASIPLDLSPGERAEFACGAATGKLGGKLGTVPFLAGRLRCSGALCVQCCPTQRQEALLLGQQHAFEFWGGVPRMVVDENLKPAVLQILQGHSRREHDVFLHFHSGYRFEALFAQVHAGWENGSVENLIGYAGRTYLVPLPAGPDLETLNEGLRANCRDEQHRIMAGRTEPIATRLALERSYLGPFPPHPPELSPLLEVLVHLTGRVRFQTPDYCVPIQYADQRLTLKAEPLRVRVCAGSDPGADHARSYEKRQVIEAWRHCVSLLLHKSFAMPWASALRHGDLPASCEAARLELVARSSQGNRELARLLELGLTHEVQAGEAALTQARAQGNWSVDVVSHLLNLARMPPVPLPPLDPSPYPAYQGKSAPADLSVYDRLLEVHP